jgi:amino acid transporter
MSSQLHGAAAAESAGAGQNAERLERQAIGLPAVTAQSAALIAPAAGSVAGLAFIVGYSGAATPLAFVIGLLVCVCVALVIGEYAKRLPSAGSFYTYLSRTFGPKTGFVTGVLLFGAYLLLFPFQLDFFGNFVSSLLAASNVHISWVVFATALIVVSTALGVAGVKPSLRTGLIGLGSEMAILTVFSLVIIIKGGASGNTLEVFYPSSSLKGSSGLLAAVVYTIFAFVGFESATTLGDEAREPRRTIPRAVMLTTLVVGIFYVVVSYAVTIGYGLSPAHVNALANASTPFNTLADHYGNGVLSVQKEELAFAYWPPVYQRDVYVRQDFDSVRNWKQLRGEHDIFNDGRLVIFPTPGHTPGHQSLLVRLDSQAYIPTGDAVYDQEKMAARCLPGLL